MGALSTPALPYVVFYQISSTPNNLMAGVNRFQSARIRFECHGSNFSDAKQLARTLKQQLQGFKGLAYSLADSRLRKSKARGSQCGRITPSRMRTTPFLQA